MTSTQKALVSLLVLTGLLFLPIVLFGGWIWDDLELVVPNQWTNDWGNLPKMFSQDLWASTEMGAGDFFYYRPLMLVSLSIDASLGFGPIGHHFHSLFWHMLCVGLLFALCAKESKAALPLFAAVSLFALHPVQTEAIAHIAARNDAMACAGILGALLLLRDPDPETRALWGAAGCATLAVFSKETAFLAPLMLWFFDRAHFGQAENHRRYFALLFPIGLAIGLRISLDGGSGLPAIPVGEALSATGKGSLFYTGALVLPWDLTPAVPISDISLRILPGLVGILLLYGLWRWTNRVGRAGLALALLAFITALPGLVMTPNTGFRYLYLPLAGLAIALHSILCRAPRWVLVAIPALLVTISATQLSYWQSNTDFWGQAYTSSPGLHSACGMFKAVEKEQLGTPARSPASDTLYNESKKWMTRSLEPPTNPYCCYSASRWAFEYSEQKKALWIAERNKKKSNASIEAQLKKHWKRTINDAVVFGERARTNGCASSEELLIPLAYATAIQGSWDIAESYLLEVERNPFGWRPVLLSAAAQQRGDTSVALGFTGDDQDKIERMNRMIQTVLKTSEAYQAP